MCLRLLVPQHGIVLLVSNYRIRQFIHQPTCRETKIIKWWTRKWKWNLMKIVGIKQTLSNEWEKRTESIENFDGDKKKEEKRKTEKEKQVQKNLFRARTMPACSCISNHLTHCRMICWLLAFVAAAPLNLLLTFLFYFFARKKSIMHTRKMHGKQFTKIHTQIIVCCNTSIHLPICIVPIYIDNVVE